MSKLPDRRLFIDEQAGSDLACNILAEGHTWEAMRDAAARVSMFWPEAVGVMAAPSNSGISLS